MWAQWLLRGVLDLERTVVVNLDETAVERAIARRPGHVLGSGRRGAARELLYERVGRSESHGHLTLVASLTPDQSLQQFLPQFVLTKDALVNRREHDRLRRLETPLVWVPGTSGWVTSENFPSILTALRRVLRHHRPNHAHVLVLDSASQHLATDVLTHASRLNIHLVFVPARLTYLLQPLDTHVFSALKLALHREQLIERSQSDTGALGPLVWIEILERCVLQVLVRETGAMRSLTMA